MIGIIDIFGGFGNQLFQLSFAKYLSKKNINTFAYVDKSLFLNKSNEYHQKRNLILPTENFGLKTLTNTQLKLLEKIKKNKRISKKFYEILTEKNEIDFDNFKRITSFNGFWQNMKYVEPVLNDLLTDLKKDKRLENALLKEKNYKTMLLVRRGDFTEYGLDLDLSFYEQALIKTDIKNGYDIFTDDVEWVKNQKLFNKSDNIFPPSDDKDKVIELFSRMLNYKNFIIGNSTFSFWGALVGSNIDSKIIISKKFAQKLNLDFSNQFSSLIEID
tara:strand:- start:72 stop:890 length:819 start_codon:yes stop_codon:yes gene_type:complete